MSIKLNKTLKRSITIQINTDKELSRSKNIKEYLIAQVWASMKRHQSHIIRLDFHFKSENGNKNRLNYISCMIEARFEGIQTIVAANKADTIELALSGAIAKMEIIIETILGAIKKR